MELLGRSNRRSLPQEMDFNGVLLSSAKDKAVSFNKFFHLITHENQYRYSSSTTIFSWLYETTWR